MLAYDLQDRTDRTLEHNKTTQKPTAEWKEEGEYEEEEEDLPRFSILTTL
jgi:hypothetical protein